VNKRDVRDRIQEILEASTLEGDAFQIDELAEEIATAITKFEMETLFDEETDDDVDTE